MPGAFYPTCLQLEVHGHSFFRGTLTHLHMERCGSSGPLQKPPLFSTALFCMPVIHQSARRAFLMPPGWERRCGEGSQLRCPGRQEGGRDCKNSQADVRDGVPKIGQSRQLCFLGRAPVA